MTAKIDGGLVSDMLCMAEACINGYRLDLDIWATHC